MKNQNGFTLIELVVVIVILGILAAIAVPKFIDMQADARLSAVNGLAGALQSASALAHAQALVDGTTTGVVDMEGNVDVVEGYPAATAAGIGAALSLDGFTATYDATATPPTATFAPDSGGSAGCEVVFTQATAALPADVDNTTATLANCQ